MRIGVLTAGGDAPGLNAAVRAIGRRALADGHEVLGIKNGFAGLLEEPDEIVLNRPALAGILAQGGTILGSVRVNLLDPPGGRERVLAHAKDRYDALVCIGGDGTMRIASWLAEAGAPVVGVPKTLDNDLAGTEYCIGFDTAVSIVSESLDRLHTTAASHHRVMVLETMGRSTGWVATMGGLAGGADLIVIPEFPITMDEVAAHVTSRRESGSAFSIVVVAEGVDPATLGERHQSSELDPVGRVRMSSHSIGHVLAHRLRDLTGFETRSTVLGHLQRGGTPSAHDRIWASHVGSAAYDAVIEGDFGTIPVVRDGRVLRVPIATTVDHDNPVPAELYQLCARFF